MAISLYCKMPELSNILYKLGHTQNWTQDILE